MSRWLPTGEETGRRLLLLFAAALAVRLAWIAASLATGGIDGVTSEDSRALMLEAQALAAGESDLGFLGRAAFDPAVMPVTLILLALSHLVGGGVTIFLILQAAADALTCLVIARMAGMLRRDLFLLAGAIAVVNPTQIALSALVLTDTFFHLFAAAALWRLMVSALGRGGGTVWGRGFALGLLLGAAALTRSAIAPWAPVALILFTIFEARREGAGRALGGAALSALVAAALVAPVLARNMERYDALTLTPQGGYHLLFWVAPATAEFAGLASRIEVERAAARRLAEIEAETGAPKNAVEADRRARGLAARMLWEMGPAAIARAWSVGAALNLALPAAAIAPPARALPHDSFHESPGAGFEKLVRYAAAPQNRAYVTVLAGSALLVVPWLLLLPVGLWRIARAAPLVALLLILWGGYVLALNGPILSPKYRLPLESAWVVVAAAGLAPRRPVPLRFTERG